jgi:ankyrin repeat protein
MSNTNFNPNSPLHHQNHLEAAKRNLQLESFNLANNSSASEDSNKDISFNTEPDNNTVYRKQTSQTAKSNTATSLLNNLKSPENLRSLLSELAGKSIAIKPAKIFNTELIEKQLSLNKTLSRAAEQGDIKAFKYLIDHGNSPYINEDPNDKYSLSPAKKLLVHFLKQPSSNIKVRDLIELIPKELADLDSKNFSKLIDKSIKDKDSNNLNKLLQTYLKHNSLDQLFEKSTQQISIADLISLTPDTIKNASVYDKETLLEEALKQNDYKSLELMLTKLDFSLSQHGHSFKNKQSLLKTAIDEDKTEFLDLLINNNIKINLKPHKPDLSNEETLEVFNHGNLKLVDKLIKLGINLETTNQDNETLLIQAIKHGRTSVAELLIKSGANLEANNDSFDFPLDMVIRQNNLKLAKVLLENGASANSKNSWDDSILAIAVKHSSPAMVQLLINNGADFSLKNGKNEDFTKVLAKNFTDYNQEINDYFLDIIHNQAKVK